MVVILTPIVLMVVGIPGQRFGKSGISGLQASQAFFFREFICRISGVLPICFGFLSGYSDQPMVNWWFGLVVWDSNP